MQYVRAAVIVALVLFGCDGKPPPIPPLDGGPRDAGLRDAGPPRDAFVPDAPDADAASIPPPDAGPPSCTVDADDVHKVATDRPGDRAIALAAAADGFGLVFTALPEGAASAEVHGVRLSSSGVLGALSAITAPPGRKETPVIGALGTTWLSAWIDNDPDTFEVRTRALATDLTPTGASAAYLTATPTVGESGPAILAGGGGALIAWVADDGTTRSVRAQRVGADGAPVGASAVAASGRRFGALALGQLAAGPALLYAVPEDTSGGPETRVYLQGLTTAGATRGGAGRIDQEGNADGTLDAALFPSGGAAVFGVLVGGSRSEVRFRAIDGDGALLGDERILAQGTDASIAAFAGGYAVSYRAVAAPAEIRLLLVSELGDVVAELPIAQAQLAGGRTTVRVSGDGNIAVAWADTDTQTSISVARLACGSGT